ncbi:MAG: cupin domain-containing protein [Thermomicrobiales bacterium]
MSQPNIVRSVHLDEEIDRYPVRTPSGRRSEILVKTPTLRVVLVTMTAGTESQEHAVEGTITIQALRGRFDIVIDDVAHPVPAGDLFALEGGVRHAVRAVEDGAFLLTIPWHGSAES